MLTVIWIGVDILKYLKRLPGGPDAPSSKNATGDLLYF